MTDSHAYEVIGEFIESHQSDTYSDIGKQLGLSRHQVCRIARLRGIRRRPGNRANLEAAVAAIEAASQKPDCASAAGEAPAPAGSVAATPDAPSTEPSALQAGERDGAGPQHPACIVAVGDGDVL